MKLLKRKQDEKPLKEIQANIVKDVKKFNKVVQDEKLEIETIQKEKHKWRHPLEWKT